MQSAYREDYCDEPPHAVAVMAITCAQTHGY
jgi:hypothetical protein